MNRRMRPGTTWQSGIGPLAPLAGGLLVLLAALPAGAEAPQNDPGSRPAAVAFQYHFDQQHPGYRLLLEKPYVNQTVTPEIFDQLWTVWEKPLREKARQATPAQRREMTLRRYGLPPRPDGGPVPLSHVRNSRGGWAINCFFCHSGRVLGTVVPGAPNTLLDMQTLREDIRLVKSRQGRLSRYDLAEALFPMNTTRGTTNAVMFAVALGALRDLQLNRRREFKMPRFVHHDMDPPPWWNVKKKKRLYCDGFVARDHRPLMAFVMVPQNSGEKIRSWEDDFRQIYQWILSLEPPKYPFPVDHRLAERGRRVFNRHCARCHGTYGPGGKYPNRVVPIEELGTDPVRLQALSDYRRQYARSWFAHGGKLEVIEEPKGYVAPPLDGIWASAPYFHNGSVPTLWHVLHPDKRPVLWRRSSEDGYDTERVGLVIQQRDRLPEGLSRWQRRQWFDTRRFGKSAAGHRYPEKLTEDQRRAVLEYLKTL